MIIIYDIEIIIIVFISVIYFYILLLLLLINSHNEPPHTCCLTDMAAKGCPETSRVLLTAAHDLV